MRLKINFTSEGNGYCSLPQAKGWFENNILGKNNELHDARSTYSLSPMLGGIRNANGEQFPNGGYMLFTTADDELMNKVVSALFSAQGTKAGTMSYKNFEMAKDFHIHSDYDIVRSITPILLMSSKRRITVKDKNFIELLTERCKEKLIFAGIEPLKAKTIKIELFHPENASVIDVQYNETHNFASKVMLVVKGNREARRTLYSMGLGSSTGCGFGTIHVND